MKLSLVATSLLALTTVLVSAAIQDIDVSVLKAAVQKLCAANEGGVFGTCCRENNNGEDIASVYGLPSCFGSIKTTTAGGVQDLFVTLPPKNILRA